MIIKHYSKHLILIKTAIFLPNRRLLYRPNLITKTIPMNSRLIHTKNECGYLAEKFKMQENHQVSTSKIALLKIQSWKFAAKTPEIGANYLHSIEDIIRRSFFEYIPAAHVLCSEAYFTAPKDN